MPRTTERVIFKKARWVRPLVQSEWVSLAKVEKVVNPPKKPVARKGMSQLGAVLEVKNPKRQPMRKHPRTLQVRIPTGKFLRLLFLARDSIPEDKPQRAREPSPPPRKISKAFMRRFLRGVWRLS